MFNTRQKKLIPILLILLCILIVCACAPKMDTQNIKTTAAFQSNGDPYGGAKHAAITVSEAEATLIKQYGKTEPATGLPCSYCFDRVETVNGTEYYCFEWRYQKSDGFLCLGNLFAATDGSAAWIAVQNAEGKWVLNSKGCTGNLCRVWTSKDAQTWEFQCGGVFHQSGNSHDSGQAEIKGVWAADESERMLTIFVDGSSLSGDYLFTLQKDGTLLLRNLAADATITLSPAETKS